MRLPVGFGKYQIAYSRVVYGNRGYGDNFKGYVFIVNKELYVSFFQPPDTSGGQILPVATSTDKAIYQSWGCPGTHISFRTTP
jgi:hypothetical protein